MWALVTRMHTPNRVCSRQAYFTFILFITGLTIAGCGNVNNSVMAVPPRPLPARGAAVTRSNASRGCPPRPTAVA
jgi:hypothetical protein